MEFMVNGLKWQLFNVPDHDESLFVGGRECLGATYYKKLEVAMNSTLPKELYRQVLIHELIHAFTFSYGVDLVANEETEESVCDFMGAHLDEIVKTVNHLMGLYPGRGISTNGSRIQ